jgi:predicted enzyme related to lactoylglutathione lyase
MAHFRALLVQRTMKARFAHVNLIVHDWRVAQFYTTVFGSVLVPPERDFQGEELDAGTARSVSGFMMVAGWCGLRSVW